MNRIILCLTVLFSNNSIASCLEHAKTQAKINQCSEMQAIQSEKVLVELVDRLTKQLPKKPRALFIDAQTAWKATKANDCAIQKWYVGRGSAATMAEAQCIEQHNRARIDRIRTFLCHPMKTTCEPAKQYDAFLNDGV